MKTAAVRVVLYAVGFGLGIVAFVIAGMILGSAGFWPGAAMYNGYFLVIAVWLVVAAATYFGTRRWSTPARWNLAVFMLGIISFSLLGAVTTLISEPESLIFWPR